MPQKPVSKPEPAQAALLPRPTRYVTDLPRILTTDETEALEQKLAASDRAGLARLLVYINPDMGGHAMDEFTLRTTNAWALGRVDSKDGLVIFIFMKEHQIGIGVGRGLEKEISEAFAKLVIEQDLAPAFGAGQFGRGLSDAADRIIAHLGGSRP
jgi:uncharacterized protein